MRSAGLLGVVAIVTLASAAPAAPKKAGKKPPTAASSPSPAQAQIDRGLELLEAGDFTGALANLLDAQKADPAADELSFHIGAAQRGLKKYGDAVKSFEAYLQKGKAADKKAQAKKQIAEIKDVAAVVTVTVPGDPADVTIDGESVGKSPFKAPFLFDAGKHTFVAKREGQAALEKTEELLGGTTLSVVLKAPEVSTEPQPLAPQVFVEGDAPPPEEPKRRRFPLLGIAVAAGGLAFIGGSVALSVMAGSRSSEVGRLFAMGGVWDSYYDRRQAEGERFESWSVALAVIGALALGTGAIMTAVSIVSAPSGSGPVEDEAPPPEQTGFFFAPSQGGLVAGLVRRW